MKPVWVPWQISSFTTLELFFSWEGVDNDDRANTNVNASFPLLNVLLSFTEIYRISPFLTEFFVSLRA